MSDSASGNSKRDDHSRFDPGACDRVDTAEPTQCVGVLSTHNSKETKAILNAISALGHNPVWLRDESVASWIEDGAVRITPDVDVIVNRLLVTKSETPLEDLHLAALFDQQAPVLNPPGAVAETLHKYNAGAKLAAAGLPVPDAFFGRSNRRFQEWTEQLPGTAAHKPTVGTNGRGVSKVSPDDTPNVKIQNHHSFVQEFLDTGAQRPSDVRVYVVDDRIVGAMRRTAPEGDWRANVALGGDVSDVTDRLGERPRRIAREAVDVLGLDVAGVDLMHVDGKWYVIEVNATAGFKGLYEATSISPAPYIAQLAIERADGIPSGPSPETLASTLDDSTPECKPPLDDPREDDDVLGFTSRVAVSGTDAVSTTVAKADTGARRTSIDTELAGEVGVGPMVGTTEVRSAGPTGTETRPLVDLDLRINGAWRTVTASVTDRSDMRFDVLLGRDVLESYTLDISRRVEE